MSDVVSQLASFRFARKSLIQAGGPLPSSGGSSNVDLSSKIVAADPKGLHIFLTVDDGDEKGYNGSGGGWEAVVDALQSFGTPISLNLNIPSNEFFPSLMPNIGRIFSIPRLTISVASPLVQGGITPPTIPGLSLQGIRGLKHLSLQRVDLRGIGADSSGSLHLGISGSISLESLRLQGCTWKDTTATPAAVSLTIPFSPSLRLLSITEGGCVPDLKVPLGVCAPSLMSLDLGPCSAVQINTMCIGARPLPLLSLSLESFPTRGSVELASESTESLLVHESLAALKLPRAGVSLCAAGHRSLLSSRFSLGASTISPRPTTSSTVATPAPVTCSDLCSGLCSSPGSFPASKRIPHPQSGTTPSSLVTASPVSWVFRGDREVYDLSSECGSDAEAGSATARGALAWCRAFVGVGGLAVPKSVFYREYSQYFQKRKIAPLKAHAFGRAVAGHMSTFSSSERVRRKGVKGLENGNYYMGIVCPLTSQSALSAVTAAAPFYGGKNGSGCTLDSIPSTSGWFQKDGADYSVSPMKSPIATKNPQRSSRISRRSTARSCTPKPKVETIEDAFIPPPFPRQLKGDHLIPQPEILPSFPMTVVPLPPPPPPPAVGPTNGSQGVFAPASHFRGILEDNPSEEEDTSHTPMKYLSEDSEAKTPASDTWFEGDEGQDSDDDEFGGCSFAPAGLFSRLLDPPGTQSANHMDLLIDAAVDMDDDVWGVLDRGAFESHANSSTSSPHFSPSP